MNVDNSDNLMRNVLVHLNLFLVHSEWYKILEETNVKLHRSFI